MISTKGVDFDPVSVCVTEHSTSCSEHLQNNQTGAQQTNNHLTYNSPAKYRLQAALFLQYIICTDRLCQTVTMRDHITWCSCNPVCIKIDSHQYYKKTT
jgi:hypothetical protein